MRSTGFRRKSTIVPILIVALVGVFALVGALSDAHKTKATAVSAPAPPARARPPPNRAPRSSLAGPSTTPQRRLPARAPTLPAPRR
jgi:hypothetical protein